MITTDEENLEKTHEKLFSLDEYDLIKFQKGNDNEDNISSNQKLVTPKSHIIIRPDIYQFEKN